MNSVAYKMYGYPNGPMFVIPNNTISKIVYENGREEVITSPSPPTSLSRSTSGPSASPSANRKEEIEQMAEGLHLEQGMNVISIDPPTLKLLT